MIIDYLKLPEMTLFMNCLNRNGNDLNSLRLQDFKLSEQTYRNIEFVKYYHEIAEKLANPQTNALQVECIVDDVQRNSRDTSRVSIGELVYCVWDLPIVADSMFVPLIFRILRHRSGDIQPSARILKHIRNNPDANFTQDLLNILSDHHEKDFSELAKNQEYLFKEISKMEPVTLLRTSDVTLDHLQKLSNMCSQSTIDSKYNYLSQIVRYIKKFRDLLKNLDKESDELDVGDGRIILENLIFKHKIPLHQLQNFITDMNIDIKGIIISKVSPSVPLIHQQTDHSQIIVESYEEVIKEITENKKFNLKIEKIQSHNETKIKDCSIETFTDDLLTYFLENGSEFCDHLVTFVLCLHLLHCERSSCGATTVVDDGTTFLSPRQRYVNEILSQRNWIIIADYLTGPTPSIQLLSLINQRDARQSSLYFSEIEDCLSSGEWQRTLDLLTFSPISSLIDDADWSILHDICYFGLSLEKDTLTNMFSIEEIKLTLYAVIGNYKNLLNFDHLIEIFENCCFDDDPIELDGEDKEDLKNSSGSISDCLEICDEDKNESNCHEGGAIRDVNSPQIARLKMRRYKTKAKRIEKKNSLNSLTVNTSEQNCDVVNERYRYKGLPALLEKSLISVLRDIFNSASELNIDSFSYYTDEEQRNLVKINILLNMDFVCNNFTQDIINLLLRSNRHLSADKIRELSDIPDHLKMKIEQSTLQKSLERIYEYNQVQCYLFLEKLMEEGRESCFALCYGILDSPDARYKEDYEFSTKLVIRDKSLIISENKPIGLEPLTLGVRSILLSFVYEKYPNSISTRRRYELWLQIVSCKAILALPKNMQHAYMYLIDSPLLIFEQIIMNAKICYADIVFSILREEYSERPLLPHDYNGHQPMTMQACNKLLVKYAKKALDFHVNDNSNYSDVSFDISRKKPLNIELSDLDLYEPRILHPNGIDKSNWVPDCKTNVCMICDQEAFTMLNRKHHCRRCGKIACSHCSARESTLSTGESVRTCEKCYNALIRQSNNQHMMLTMTSGDFNKEYTYILTLDDEQNTKTREDHYFEHAPSTSLCLSLLDLLTCNETKNKTMLELCDYVSKQLHRGLHSIEVDYSLVINMLKYLLFRTKCNLSSLSSNSSVCQNYMTNLDCLESLVISEYSPLPSLQLLQNPQFVSQLRDSLIEDERYSLALNVSTKYALDCKGVWHSMAMVSLKTQEYQKARELFARCLKVPTDKNIHIISVDKILNMIKKHFENKFIFKKILLVPALLSPPIYPRTKHKVIHDETLYYYTKYASHMTFLTMYVSGNMIREALEYVSREKPKSEVFIEAVLVPCHISNRGLMEIMERYIDKKIYSVYLKASCLHFSKVRLYRTLYKWQIFMKDYIRAAMTCITFFYERQSLDYKALHRRLVYLVDARNHLQTYMNDVNWPAKAAELGCLVIPRTQVFHQIFLIDTQIAITKFFERNYQNIENYMPSPAIPVHRDLVNKAEIREYRLGRMKRKLTPTLFGSEEDQKHVICMLILCGNHVQDGYGIAYRLITELNLNPVNIYETIVIHCARTNLLPKISELVNCLNDDSIVDNNLNDKIIGAAIKEYTSSETKIKDIEVLVSLFHYPCNKVNALIELGQLKHAYVIAVRVKEIEYILKIRVAAICSNQLHVERMCNSWLNSNRLGEPED